MRLDTPPKPAHGRVPGQGPSLGAETPDLPLLLRRREVVDVERVFGEHGGLPSGRLDHDAVVLPVTFFG